MHTGWYVWLELSCLTNRTIHQLRKMEQTYLPILIWILSQSRRAPGQVVQGKDDLGGLVKGKERKKIVWP